MTTVWSSRCMLVNGSMVVSIDYFKRIFAKLRNFFGGNVQSYETLIDRARSEAVLRMKESCPDADMIINLRLATSSITKGAGNRYHCCRCLHHGRRLRFYPIVYSDSQLQYSQTRERLADEKALQVLNCFYSHVGGVTEFFNAMTPDDKKENSLIGHYFSSHPEALERIKNQQKIWI